MKYLLVILAFVMLFQMCAGVREQIKAFPNINVSMSIDGRAYFVRLDKNTTAKVVKILEIIESVMDSVGQIDLKKETDK